MLSNNSRKRQKCSILLAIFVWQLELATDDYQILLTNPGSTSAETVLRLRQLPFCLALRPIRVIGCLLARANCQCRLHASLGKRPRSDSAFPQPGTAKIPSCSLRLDCLSGSVLPTFESSFSIGLKLKLLAQVVTNRYQDHDTISVITDERRNNYMHSHRSPSILARAQRNRPDKRNLSRSVVHSLSTR